MWLVIWCCRDLLFECVKQQYQGFLVITILQFGRSRHALLPFLWGVFEFLSCFVVFIHSHKMTKAWWVLVSFGFFVVYAGIFWEVLISCCIPLFLRSSSPLFFSFVCLSFFLSLLLLPTQPSTTAAPKPKHMARHRHQSKPGFWKRKHANNENAITGLTAQ